MWATLALLSAFALPATILTYPPLAFIAGAGVLYFGGKADGEMGGNALLAWVLFLATAVGIAAVAVAAWQTYLSLLFA